MDHYCKGKNQEELLSKDNVPISNLPEEFSWIEVTGSTRIKNIIGNLGKMLRQDKFLVLSGSGQSTSKVVSIAEILKRRHKHIQERIELGERLVQEFWEPKDEDECLDTLVVTRRIPTIHVLLDVSQKPTLTPDDELYEAWWGKPGLKPKKEKGVKPDPKPKKEKGEKQEHKTKKEKGEKHQEPKPKKENGEKQDPKS